MRVAGEQSADGAEELGAAGVVGPGQRGVDDGVVERTAEVARRHRLRWAGCELQVRQPELRHGAATELERLRAVEWEPFRAAIAYL